MWQRIGVIWWTSGGRISSHCCKTRGTFKPCKSQAWGSHHGVPLVKGRWTQRDSKFEGSVGLIQSNRASNQSTKWNKTPNVGKEQWDCFWLQVPPGASYFVLSLLKCISSFLSHQQPALSAKYIVGNGIETRIAECSQLVLKQFVIS